MSTSESKPFSISGNSYRPKDDSLTAEILNQMGFASTDGKLYSRGQMDYSLDNGDISYNGKEIVNNCRSAQVLANLFYNITSQRIEW